MPARPPCRLPFNLNDVSGKEAEVAINKGRRSNRIAGYIRHFPAIASPQLKISLTAARFGSSLHECGDFEVPISWSAHSPSELQSQSRTRNGANFGIGALVQEIVGAAMNLEDR